MAFQGLLFQSFQRMFFPQFFSKSDFLRSDYLLFLSERSRLYGKKYREISGGRVEMESEKKSKNTPGVFRKVPK